MKNLFFVLLSVICVSKQALASGCVNDSFYDLEAVAKSVGASSCYFEPLAKVVNPQSMADRQFNYFAEKINEYAMVFDTKVIDSAGLEFMFYPEIAKNLLAEEDAQKIEFEYFQSFRCSLEGQQKEVKSKIFTFGYVGLTGVCLTKNKVSW